MKTKFSVLFHPLAENEYYESIEWYENSQNGLGLQFINDIEKSINLISSNPLLYPKKKGNLREAVVTKFPFVIVFEFKEKNNAIIVLSIYHTSRNPKKKYRKFGQRKK